MSLNQITSKPESNTQTTNELPTPTLKPKPDRQLRPKKQRQPFQKATITEMATEYSQTSEIQTHTQTIGTKASAILDQSILDKVQKCLNRAAHTSSTELEAKAALFLAQKLMAQYNVTQVDMMAMTKDDDKAVDGKSTKAQYGGQSVVTIGNTKDRSKRPINESFVKKLAQSMSTFFNCKHFSSQEMFSISWTFYGIAENTVAAAMGFEMAHNKILDWACSYKGGSPTFSYRIGVADGLVAMANREKKRELEGLRRKELAMVAAREHEEAQDHQRKIDRLHYFPPSVETHMTDSEPKGDSHFTEVDVIDHGVRSFGSSMIVDRIHNNQDDNGGEDVDDGKAIGEDAAVDFNWNDENHIDLTCDVDENIQKLIKREPEENTDFTSVPATTPSEIVKQEFSKMPPPPVMSEPRGSPWASEMQLSRFRATSEQVADDFLKERNIELTHSYERHVMARDSNAYRQGWKDSTKINFRQRLLE
jgi:hypothetical protein